MTFDISRQRVDWRRQQSATIPVVDGGMDTAECGFVHTSQLFLPHIVGHDSAAAALSHHNIHRQLGSSTPRPRRLTSSRCRDGSQNSRNWENENTLLLCSFVVKGTGYNAPWAGLSWKLNQPQEINWHIWNSEHGWIMFQFSVQVFDPKISSSVKVSRKSPRSDIYSVKLYKNISRCTSCNSPTWHV